MNANVSSSRIDPAREALAAKALRESIAALNAGDDEDLVLDTIEGETGLFEAIDALLARLIADKGLISGLAGAYAELAARQARFERRVETTRALIEQALSIAEIVKLERPAATLSMTQRGPKLEVATEAEIPARFWKASDPKLDRKALTDALKAGEDIAGAYLSNAAPTLAIRTK